MIRWIKRFFGYLPFMEKEPCNARAILKNSIYYCTRNAGHIGPHRTYLGKYLWPWHWKRNPNEK